MADSVSGDVTGQIPILSDVFGSKSSVALYKPTIFSQEQTKALTEDIGAFPDITQLGDLYQTYMLNDLNRALPGFSGLLASGGATTQEMLDAASPLLRGEIPQDVQEQIQRSTAFQSLQSGTAGSPMSRALTARDLGLTSLDLMNQGANLAQQGGNAAQRWTGLVEGTMLNPSSMLITPQQQAALTMQNNLYKQATQQYANNLAAAPDPVAKGISDTIINLVGAYLGAGKGGGGGGIAPNYSASAAAGQAPNLSYTPSSYMTAQPGSVAAGATDVTNPGYFSQPTYVNDGAYQPLPSSTGGAEIGQPGGGVIDQYGSFNPYSNYGI